MGVTDTPLAFEENGLGDSFCCCPKGFPALGNWAVAEDLCNGGGGAVGAAADGLNGLLVAAAGAGAGVGIGGAGAPPPPPPPPNGDLNWIAAEVPN